jgi:hypothetical protein
VNGAHVAVQAAAAYRLTRLLQVDSLPPLPAVRSWLITRYPDHPLIELVSCPWCLGFWVSVGVVAADAFVPKLWRPLALSLALSAAVGHLRGLDGDED